jgi:hypothetical protein
VIPTLAGRQSSSTTGQSIEHSAQTSERNRIIHVGTRNDHVRHHETKLLQSATSFLMSGAGRLSKNAYSHLDPEECEKNLALVASIQRVSCFAVSESYRKNLETMHANLGVVVTLQN